MSADNTNSTNYPRPTATPLVCADLAPLHARLGEKPEDFVVDEIPAYLPCGTGNHRYLRIRKQLMNTQDLLHCLALAAAIPPGAVLARTGPGSRGAVV